MPHEGARPERESRSEFLRGQMRQWMDEVVAAVKSNSSNEHVVAFTGFDFAGGFVFRENAATLFVKT